MTILKEKNLIKYNEFVLQIRTSIKKLEEKTFIIYIYISHTPQSTILMKIKNIYFPNMTILKRVRKKDIIY